MVSDTEAGPPSGRNVIDDLDSRIPTNFYWYLAVLACIGGFLFGYDTSNIGSALGFLPYHLSSFATGYLVAGASLGAAAGALARHLVAACNESEPPVALDLQRLTAIKRQRAERAAAYFSENAARWDRIRSLYIDEREVEAALVEIIAAAAPRDLLDIGTGTGRMIEVLAPRVGQALGIDQSREMLAVARVNLERAGTSNGMSGTSATSWKSKATAMVIAVAAKGGVARS